VELIELIVCMVKEEFCIMTEVSGYIYGFSKCLGVCSAFLAELWGIFYGLKIARECGFHKLEFRVDSRVVGFNLEFGNHGSVIGSSLLIKY
jgi:ribonuclease HI